MARKQPHVGRHAHPGHVGIHRERLILAVEGREDGGDTLPNEVLGVRVLFERDQMRVIVPKARRDHEPGSIDHSARTCGGEIGSDGDDPVSPDRDIGHVPRRSRTVDDGPSLE